MSKKKQTKLFFWIVAIGFIVTIVFTIKYYSMIFSSNVDLQKKDLTYLYIKTNSNEEDVYKLLIDSSYLKDFDSFKWVATKKNYKNNVKSGRYLIVEGMSNNDLVNMLRAGSQDPINLVFNNIRTKEEFAGRIAEQIEPDSLTILNSLNNSDILKSFGLNKNTVISMFIPNTYELYWNTSAKIFLERMYKEFNKFWTNDRLNKIKGSGLTKIEVMILSSIVEQETQMNDEKERLAGVYLNRLKKGMRLQADPTVKFALGDFEIKRVLTEHLSINSPYNTYKYKGLPPGPICIPSISSIDAVLQAEQHNYIFFCAKDDFSGYHVFAKSLRQHNVNAAKYQHALNKNRVFK